MTNTSLSLIDLLKHNAIHDPGRFGTIIPLDVAIDIIRQHEAANAEKCKVIAEKDCQATFDKYMETAFKGKISYLKEIVWDAWKACWDLRDIKYNELLQSSKDFMKTSGKYDTTLEAALNQKEELLDRLIYVIYNPEECSWDVMLNLGTASVRGQNAIVIKNFAREKHAKLFRDAIIGDASAHKEEDRSIQNAEAPTVSGSNLAVPEEKSNSTLIGWHCPNCGPLQPVEVTFHENCAKCGVFVGDIDAPSEIWDNGNAAGMAAQDWIRENSPDWVVTISEANDLVNAILPHLKAAPKREVIADWQPIETAPKNKAILIYYKNGCGKGRTIKAVFIARWTVESDPESDNCEYSEEKDCYFTPEGWYEEIDNWDDFSSVAIDSRNKPLLWMPLPIPTEIEDGGSNG